MPSIFSPIPAEIERKAPGTGGKPPVDRRPTGGGGGGGDDDWRKHRRGPREVLYRTRAFVFCALAGDMMFFLVLVVLFYARQAGTHMDPRTLRQVGDWHPVLLPPRTRIEDTVLDLIEGLSDPADRYDLICRAIGGLLTTAPRLRRALEKRGRFRDRREAESALADAGQGALSNLERWYLRDVERRHKLPVATRQARFKVGGQSIYLDNLYEDYLVCVELDGTAAHPAGEQWRDKRRDRRNLAAEKIVTMRLGYLDLCTQEARCRTAGEVVGVLRDRGPWVGAGCRLPGCPV